MTEEPATIVAVGQREVDRRTAVNVSVKKAPPPQVRTPVGGVVTALGPPGPVAVGAMIIELDGVPVLIYRGSPLFRDLAIGDQGDDVADVSAFLVSLGLLDASSRSDTYGYPTADAVRRLQEERLGVAADGRFRVSYVTRLVQSMRAVASYTVSLGDRVSADATVALGPRKPIEVTMSPLAGDSVGALPDYGGQPLVLQFGGLQIPLANPSPVGAELANLAADLDQGVRDGRIRKGDAANGTAGQYVGGILALRRAQRHGVVPTTAVRVGGDGAMCVLVAKNEDDNPTPHLLDAAEAGSELGSVFVDASLVGQQVVRDASLAPGTECR